MGLSTTNTRTPPPPAAALYDTPPTAKEAVDYLNRTTARITSFESRDVDLEIKADRSVNVHATLYCDKPRNFRMRAKKPLVGSDAADFGSNNDEFWYWISEDRPPDLYHCSYSDLSRGNVRLPFPLHPDWMLEALGVSAPAPLGTPEQEQARGRTLEVRQSPDKKSIYLYERTLSIQSQPVTKVTVLNNFTAQGTTPQVTGHYLYDTNTKSLICQATITKVQYDAASGAMVPQKIEFEWPAMKLTLSMTLGEVMVNDPKLPGNAKLFTRPHKADVREVDLARGAPITSPTGLQRVGATR